MCCNTAKKLSVTEWRFVFMKLFIDTANIDEIKKIYSLGIIDGVTTNPSLIAKEGRDFEQTVKEIAEIVDGPISAEVISLESDKMVKEALELSKIHQNVVIKIPMCSEGLKAVKHLDERGIKTNVTLIFSALQALLAAKAGATYVSPFLGRLDDVGQEGLVLIQEIVELFNAQNLKTQIICASIRNPIHVLRCGQLGADIATVPYKTLIQMIDHPLTKLGIDRFLADWNA